MAGVRNGKGEELFPDGTKFDLPLLVEKSPSFKSVIRFFACCLPSNRYTGQYVNDKRCGAGVLLLATGSRYEGSFKDDEFDGEGVMTMFDGTVLSGEWIGMMTLSTNE